MDRETGDAVVLETLSRIKGIVKAVPILDEDRQTLLEIETEAEEKSLMGLGKVVNVGVRRLTLCDWLYVALTDMDFDWGRKPNLLMKKGDQIVGEEVSDPEKIKKLSGDRNVWFMHRNFVVYKDRVAFPQDVMQKICHFEIPCHLAEWCDIEDEHFRCHEILYAWPSTPCDVFLKKKYFGGSDERGSGTVLLGVNLDRGEKG